MMCFCPLNIPKISLQHIQMVKPTLCFQDDSKLFHSWRIGSRNLKRMMEITKIHNQSALILHIWSLGHKQEMLLVEVLLEKGFPGSTGSEESACQFRRCRFDPWIGKIPLRRKWQPTPVFLPGKSHGQRSLVGYSPWGCKELDMT